jgi:predicted enzyme related to lactoylglutathione lyase
MSFTPTHPVVWVEIPVSDMEAARRFYEAVFGWALRPNSDGPNPMLDIPSADPAGGVAGHLYPGKPAGEGRGPTIHLAVDGDVEAAADRVRAAGGTVLPMPPETIPPGRFIYAIDPDGNSLGLFEPATGG